MSGEFDSSDFGGGGYNENPAVKELKRISLSLERMYDFKEKEIETARKTMDPTLFNLCEVTNCFNFVGSRVKPKEPDVLFYEITVLLTDSQELAALLSGTDDEEAQKVLQANLNLVEKIKCWLYAIHKTKENPIGDLLGKTLWKPHFSVGIPKKKNDGVTATEGGGIYGSESEFGM